MAALIGAMCGIELRRLRYEITRRLLPVIVRAVSVSQPSFCTQDAQDIVNAIDAEGFAIIVSPDFEEPSR
jgi:hypothetical protein